MLIRSQDRKTLINLDSTMGIFIGETFSDIPEEKQITAIIGDRISFTIGTYSTEEKAMAVLDDLSQTYFLGRLKFSEEAVVRIQDGSPVVYWMPEDSEVEDE